MTALLPASRPRRRDCRRAERRHASRPSRRRCACAIGSPSSSNRSRAAPATAATRWSACAAASSASRGRRPSSATATTPSSTASPRTTRSRRCARSCRRRRAHGPLPCLLAQASATWPTRRPPAGNACPCRQPDPIGMPEALFHLPDVLIVFDHLAQTATLATIEGPRCRRAPGRDDRPARAAQPR